jgi:hypothetical protein
MAGIKKQLWGLVCCLSLAISVAPASARAQFLPAAARSTEAPEAFIGRIIKLYGPGSRWWATEETGNHDAYRDRVSREFYEPTFAKLLNDNGALASAHAEGVDLDYDPVCQCQDGPGHIRLRSVEPGAQQLVKAHVAGPDCSGDRAECSDYVIVLGRTPGGWKIHDVVDSTGSVRGRLIRHNACLRRSHSRAEAERCLD